MPRYLFLVNPILIILSVAAVALGGYLAHRLCILAEDVCLGIKECCQGDFTPSDWSSPEL